MRMKLVSTTIIWQQNKKPHQIKVEVSSPTVYYRGRERDCSNWPYPFSFMKFNLKEAVNLILDNKRIKIKFIRKLSTIAQKFTFFGGNRLGTRVSHHVAHAVSSGDWKKNSRLVISYIAQGRKRKPTSCSIIHTHSRPKEECQGCYLFIEYGRKNTIRASARNDFDLNM